MITTSRTRVIGSKENNNYAFDPDGRNTVSTTNIHESAEVIWCTENTRSAARCEQFVNLKFKIKKNESI